MTAQAHADAANVRVSLCEHYFAPANAHGDYLATGGRLVFGGAATVNLAVTDDAECYLGSNLTVRTGGELTLVGGDCWVGFTGSGTKTATGPPAFVAAQSDVANAGVRIGKIQRFKLRGDDPTATVNATYVRTSLRIDKTGLTAGSQHDLGGGAGSGITFTNPNNITLPAGVTLTSGKLVLTA